MVQIFVEEGGRRDGKGGSNVAKAGRMKAEALGLNTSKQNRSSDRY
jgi:hypothetical protein